MYDCVCIYIYICIRRSADKRTADLRTKILDFRGLDSSRVLNGCNSQAHREFPGNSESSNLSRDILSREIGRTGPGRRRQTWQRP